MGPPGLGSGVGAGCALLAGRRPEAVCRRIAAPMVQQAPRFRAPAARRVVGTAGCDALVTAPAPGRVEAGLVHCTRLRRVTGPREGPVAPAMATILDRPASDAAPAVAQPLGAMSRPLVAAVSGPLAAAVLGTTAVVAGLLWDISWHASIGRDTFWTPAHLAIYLGGLLCGLSAGWLALSTTFAGTAAQRRMAVGCWGLRGTL